MTTPPSHPAIIPDLPNCSGVTDLSRLGLFTPRPHSSLEKALLAATRYIEGAADTASEIAGQRKDRFPPPPRQVVQQLEAAQTLVKASLEAMDRMRNAANDD